MSGQQIYENFANGVGPGGLMQAADHVNSFQARYDHRAADIRSLAAAMEEGWTGDAAGAASRGAGPLAAEHAQAAEAMSMAQAGLTAQSSAWHDVQAKVQPVPPVPQAPPPMTELLGVQSVIDADIESRTRQSNDVAAANVAAMKSWSTASDETGRAMPTSYGQIDANAMNISTAQPSPVVHSPAGHGGQSGPVQPGHAAGPAPATGAYGGANSATPSSVVASGAPSSPVGAVPPHAAGSGGDSSTSPSNYVAPRAQTGSEPGGASGNPGLYRSGVLDSNAPGASGGGSWSSGGFPVGGAGGSGSSGSGVGPGGRAGGANMPVGGRGSGVGASEEAPTRGGAGGASGSSSGRAGGAGVGGVGTGAERKAEEDEEHERKYVLSDDEAFLAADDGERLVDPQTGMAASPAVIGEAPKRRV